MLFCGVATGLPLLFGLFFHELPIALYGAIMGYFLTVYDHVGPLGHRLFAVSVSFLMLVSGFALGLHLQGRPVEQSFAIAVMAYWVGVMGGQGAELERAVLFSLFALIMAAHATLVGPGTVLPILMYASIGYVFILLATVVYLFFWTPPPGAYSPLSRSLKRPLESPSSLHLHAFVYASIAVFAAWLVDRAGIERGYWTIITVLLILKPDRQESFYRIIQRLIGTILGVLVAAAVVRFVHTPGVVVGLIALSAFFVPWATKKNYWLVSLLISVLVVLLLELPIIQHGDFHVPLLRVYATVYGGALSLAAILLSKILSVAFRR